MFFRQQEILQGPRAKTNFSQDFLYDYSSALVFKGNLCTSVEDELRFNQVAFSRVSSRAF